MPEKYQLIILNGTTSSGKTSAAKAMQKILPETFLHFQIDMFWNMVPEHMDANSETFPHLKAAMLDSVEALLKHGHNVILDTVTYGDNVNKMRENFKAYDPFIVRVYADQNIVDERERKRGDRWIGQAASQAPVIHTGVLYDFEIDTSFITADETAESIATTYTKTRPVIL